MGTPIGPDTNKYFLSQASLQVTDGETAVADDVNDVVKKTNSAFDLVESDFDELSVAYERAQEWATNDQGYAIVPTATEKEYSSRAWAIESKDWASADDGSFLAGDTIHLAESTVDGVPETLSYPSAKTSADWSKTQADASATSAAEALASENKAHLWAEEAYGVEVEPGEYSAYHWATIALGQNTISAGDDVSIDTTGTGPFDFEINVVSGNPIVTAGNELTVSTTGTGSYADPYVYEIGNQAPHKNLLLNPFGFHNQRGITSTISTSGEYHLDRWFAKDTYGGAGSPDIGQGRIYDGSSYTWSSIVLYRIGVASGNPEATIEQRIPASSNEDILKLGKNITASCYASAEGAGVGHDQIVYGYIVVPSAKDSYTSSTATLKVTSSTLAGNSGAEVVSFTTPLTYDMIRYGFAIRWKAKAVTVGGDLWTDLTDFRCTVSDVRVPVLEYDLHEDLIGCQRYYTASNNLIFQSGYGGSTASYGTTCYYPVHMRTSSPTVTLSNYLLTPAFPGGTPVWSATYVDEQGFRPQVTGGTGGTSPITIMRFDYTADAEIY